VVRAVITLFCVLAALALSATAPAGATATGDRSAEGERASLALAGAGDSAVAHVLRARVPEALQGRILPRHAGTDASDAWAELPATLDGRVRLGTPGRADVGRAGWKMLDVPDLQRHELARGAMYLGSEWDVLQSMDEDRLREYIVVREHQGERTWSWKLFTAEPGTSPRIVRGGRIDLGGGWFLEPPKLLDAELAELDRPVSWQLDGDVLSLTFDDAGLELPYIIDPDVTPPVASFVQWTESSPYAYYNPANDINRLWFNSSQGGSAVATINATDAESGVDYVTWPSPPTGWTPAGANDSTATDAPGLVGTYFDNAQRPGTGGCTVSPQYPCNNFTGINFTRIDPNIDFNWGGGTPYAALGTDTFSIRWEGKIEAPENGTYYFQTRSDDGVRLWVNNVEMASRWDDHGPTDYSGCVGGISLVAGTKYDIRMEFYENGGGAEARLRWRLPSQAGAYQTPAGCNTNVSPPQNHATSLGGGGSATYPAVPASAFSTGGGSYTRTFTWTNGDSGGVVNATATNGDGLVTPAMPIEFEEDATAPVDGSGGSFDIQTPGWGQNANNRVDFPAAASFTDAGSSAPGVGAIYRYVQRRDGVADGAGGCDTTAGSWTTIATNPAGTNINNGAVSIPAAGVCSEFRYRIQDEVGNAYDMYASGFRGWDNVNPSGVVTSITEGTNPQYQKVVGANVVFVNGAMSGDFTVAATPTDAHSGPQYVRFYAPGAAWTPAANSDVLDPGPFEQVFGWNATAVNPGGENIQVTDYSGRNGTVTNAFTINRDVTGPAGGTLAFWTPTWRNVLDVPVQMTATMTDGGAGVASYQLQREEIPLAGATCGVFTGAGHVNIGAQVLGDPPPSLGTINDLTVVDGMCYRYRVEATDHVGNIGYLAPAQSVRVDDTDPTGTLNALPPTGSGTIAIGGTGTDTLSGVANVTVRLENLDVVGPITVLYTDASVAPNWGNYNWVTTALNGNYRLHVDVTDVAGNVATSVVTHDILLDNSAPTLVFDGFTDGVTPQYSHINPLDDTQAWVRTSAPAAGSLFANFTPDDPQSGIDYITVPAGAASWTPGVATQVQDPGPYVQEYVWASGAGNFNTRTATARSNGGITSTPATPFTITTDNTNPNTGAVTYPTAGWNTTGSVTISVTNYLDGAGSGIYHQQLLRDEVARPPGGCGGAAWPGTYPTLVAETVAGDVNQTLPASVVDSTLAHGMCYRYRLVATDNVTNTTGTSTTPGIVATDLVAPTATIDATPASPFMGTETITGTSADGPTGPNSQVASVTLRWENTGDFTTGTVNTDTSASPIWSIAFNTTLGGTPDGTYNLYVDVVDVATNSVVTVASRLGVIIDNSPPVIDLASYTKGPAPDCQHWAGLPSTTFWFSPTGVTCGGSEFTVEVTATDAPGGIQEVQFPSGWVTILPDRGNPSLDPTAPYTERYTYGAGVGAPAPANIIARGNSGATTNLNTHFARDVAGPTSSTTFTGPGSNASPAWWSNAATIPVGIGPVLAGATDTGGAGMPDGVTYPYRHVVERRSNSNVGCTTWNAWAPVGAVGELPPTFNDATTLDNECYQYRVGIFDLVNNRTYFADTVNQVKIDRTLPTGTLNPVPAYVKGSSVALSGLSGDTRSGVASIAVRLGAGPANACTPAVAGAWSCTWDTTAAPNGPTTLVLVVTDTAGNVLDTVTQATYVDNEVPTGAVTLTPGANPQFQHVVPGPTPRIYINTDEASGAFAADVAVTEAFSGVANVQFPALLGGGWNRTPATGLVAAPGPYTVTYDWTGPGAGDPGPQSAQIADNAANFGSAPFEVIADIADPTGSALTYTGGPATVPSITFAEGADAGSGVATWRIERRETDVIGPGTCDPFTLPWGTVATDPVGSPWTDGAAALGKCYQYRLVVVDRVGNAVTIDDPELDTITIEPAGIVITETGAGPSTDVTENGPTDTYAVRLRTAPAGNVTITLGNVDGQVSTSSPTLTFTPGNWSVDQVVTVTAFDDDVDEVPDPNTGTITHVAASGGDPDYDGLVGADVVANVTDDDTAGFLLSPSSTSVDVAELTATSDTYTIVLTSEPTFDVTVTLGNVDGEVTVGAPLVFTPANWDTPQTVTVTAVDDDIDEIDPHPGVVTHAVTSADPLYSPLTIGDVTADVTDDDTVGVTVTPTSGLTLDESDVPTTVQYTVVLDSEPLGDVTINVSGDADATPSPSSLLFTPANWDTPQPVTMTVVNDLIVEGAHVSTVSHLASSPLDPAYAIAAVAPVAIDVVDDDVPGIEVTPLGPLAATEGGATAAYDIRLESEPTANVDISFATGTQLDLITTLTFTPANWNTFQTVTVTATNDDVDEPTTHPGTIVHAVVSGDANYGGWVLADMLVDITDDDDAGITIDELGGVDVDEANLPATDTFTVVLESEPTAPITVTLADDGQATPSSPTLTFTPANWDTAQVVTVTAVNDAIDESSPHPGTITVTAAGDPLYAALAAQDVVADVLDDDTASVIVAPGTLALDETLPATDTYTVVLGSEPSGSVTVTATPNAQVALVGSGALVFTPANWATPQTITVEAIDDDLVELPTHPGQLTHVVTGADPAYTAITPAAKDADVLDNDVPGISIDELGGVEAEEGGPDGTYEVVLTAQPTGDVVVTLTDDAQVDASPSPITFTNANWNVPQVVTVAAVDDAIQELSPHPGTITHAVSSVDPLWASLVSAPPVVADVIDDDVAAIIVTSSSPYALDEDTPAATVSYDVVLDTEPSVDVVITLTVPGDLNADVTTLTFTPANWNATQTVTVNAIDDLVTEAPVHMRLITHAVASGDGFYAPLTMPDVQFDVTDNDIPGIVVSETALSVAEGGATDTFSVVLETQPTADVTVDLVGTQVGFDVDPLVFTTANWATPQVVTVNAIQDPIDEADPHAGLVELDVTSADLVYDAWSLTDITVDVGDDDDAGVTVTPGTGTPLAVDEATPGTDTYTLVLDTQPSADVVVAVATLDGQTVVDLPTVTFTPLNWNVAQTVTVTAVDDDIDEAATHAALVTHSTTSADPNYGPALVVDDQPVDVADDDTADVIVNPTGGLLLDEAAIGTTATFDVRLGSQPLSNVTVTLATSDLQTTVDLPTLTFTPATWAADQTVTVTVVDDLIAEGTPHVGTIETSATSGDALYGAINPLDVLADIDDNDAAGITITESAGSTNVDEALVSDTYDVVLTSQPTAPVTIDITGGLDASTTPVQLTFTPANWNVVQVVTVNGTPDWVIEGLHTQLITHVASSADPDYASPAVTIADVTANITDDDIAGATITPTLVAVGEDVTGTDTYDVVLDAEPTADVTITLTPDAQLETDVPALVFTPLNWNVAQTVTVNGFDDLVVETSPHAGTITHAMTSADPDFNVAVADVTADITDNDVPGVVVSPTLLSVIEGGAGSSFLVRLDSVPASPVDVVFTEPGQLDPIATITFTAGNWNVDQTVNVDAFNDFIDEGAHSTTITIDTSSPDPFYASGALTIPDVDVDITDNDTAGILLAPPSGLAGTEGGANVGYAISLMSEPTDDVTITLAGDADGAPVVTSYLFTSANWATPQPVDVAIVNDLIAEGAHTSTITGTIAAGTDAVYGAVAVPDQVIDITDNDNAAVIFTPALPGPRSVVENGATDTYTVQLDTIPTGDVTIDITSLAGQASVDVPTLTFTAGNWNVPQVVTVSAVDDEVAEVSPHLDTLTHVAGGADPIYAALTLGDMDVEIDDDDLPGVLINATIPDTAATEGGLGDTVEVMLESQPTDDVTVTLTGVQVDLAPLALTFTPANWNVPQVVTVDATDDDVFEGPHVGTIDALTGSVLDPFYAGVSATQHTVLITDDDTAGVIVTQPAATDLDEAADTVAQTYQVRLESEPIADVDVTILPDAQVDATPLTLTFTSATWNVDQSVDVTPVDDAISEADPHPGIVSHDTTSVGDPAYGTGVLTIDDVTFDVADNDTPGISITPTSGHVVGEGGATSTYDVVLLSQPTADVVFAPVSTQLEWSVADIAFTALNWNVPQTVTLQAIDDSVDEADPHPGTLDMSITSGDAGYTALTPATVDATITDNDTSDLEITPTSGLVVDEDGVLPTASYVLTLTSIPSGPVTVTLDGGTQVTPSALTVVLDGTNWNTGVSVDVAAIDDDVFEGTPHAGTVTHAMASADPNFDAETGPDQVVDITDNDAAGVTITPTGADTTVAEDGSLVDTYDVVLTSEPVADVTIDITPDAQVDTAQATLTFTSATWDTPQTVDVTAVDDFVIEAPTHPGTISHAATSGDANYQSPALTIADEVANVLDDDVADVVVTPAGGTFEVAEGGTTDDIVVTLTSEPVAPVTIDLTTPDGETTAAPSPIVLDATNWNTGVTVTVTAVDDGFIEGAHSGDVVFTVDPGSDAAYVGLIVPNATATITDNDSAAVLVDVLDGISLDEAAVGTTDTFNVRLQASPAAGQTVDVDVTELAPGGQVLLAPATLTFDDANWNVDQAVTVTVVDDSIDETDPHTQAIHFETTSADLDFDALVTADVDATIADDDDAGLVVDTSTVAVAEAGATSATVNVQLLSQPVGDVEVAIAFDSQVTVSPAGPLVFNAGNWNVDQPITITAIDDAIDELDPHPGIVTLDASSVGAADPSYDVLADETVTADVADDDTSDVVVTLASGTEVDEAVAGTTMVWDVVLDSQPTGNVDVTFTPDGQLELVGSGTLTFTPGNWNVAQQVETRAFDDETDELDPHPGVLAIGMGGADPIYAGLTPAPLTVDVRDDDTAGVTITQAPTPQPLAEDGSLPAATYDVVLDSQPLGDVTVSVTADAQVDAGATTSLTFTPANWNAAQQVTVTAVDDPITEPTPHAGYVAHASDSATDPAYSTVAALVVADAEFAIDDDDVAGFTLNPVTPTPAVDEAGATSATYELAIDTIPAADVTVDFAATNGDVTVSPASHTFTAANYATPVTITVTAIDDALVEGAHTDLVTHVVNPSSDPTYLGAPPIADVTVDVADDDVAEVVIDDLGGITLDEADVPTTDTFTVALKAQPLSDVSVLLGTADGQGNVDLPVLTFTSLDWMTPQTVTVTVVDDAITEADPHPGAITIATTSADLDFDSLVTPDVATSIADNDTPAFVITDSPDMTMDEADVAGTERTMNIALATNPATPVTINVLPDVQLGLQSLPAIVLDGTNWNTGVDVVVRAIDDPTVEADPHPGVVSFVVDPSSDAGYVPLPIGPRTFDIADDDNAGITFTPALPGPLAITEGGAGASYDIVLDAQPLASVTIGVETPDGQSTVAPALPTFTPANWNVPQTITVTAVDDQVAEGSPHAGQVVHDVTGDAAFAALTPGAMDLDITDNDVAGVNVTWASFPALRTIAEDGSLPAVTYDVLLGSRPTADVTVTLAPDTQVAVGGATTLTFTPANWNVPQVVTVTAVDDVITEADPHPGLITHTSDSTDPNYASAAALTIADATFSIEDDDAPGFTLTPTTPTPSVAEAGATSASYDLSIDTFPVVGVTVDFAATNGDVTVSPASHTFTPGNAGTPVTITVTAIDDGLPEGPHVDLVTHVVNASSDAGYVGVTIPDVSVDVADDDVAEVRIDELGGVAVDETGETSDTIEVRLGAEPAADVQVSFVADVAQLKDMSASTVTFTSANWNTPQTVSIQAEDDPFSEATPHVSTVTSVTSSGDAAFDALSGPGVDVDITDNDIAGVIVTDPALLAMDEADTAGTERLVNVRLATSPAANVTIDATSDAQVAVQGGPFVLDSSNWSTGIDIPVRAVDDFVAEASPHDGIATFAVATGSDAAYVGLPSESTTFQIADNDVAGLTCDPGSDWSLLAGRLQLSESPADATHDVSCFLTPASPPAADVDVTITTTPGSQFTADQAVVTLPAGGAGAVEVTFTATPDAIAEATTTGTIGFAIASTDPIFGALTIPDIDVDITDDDSVGVTVAPTTPIPLTEGGASQTFTVVLTSQPTAATTIAVTGDAQVGATPASLEFLPANWNVPQTVTVTAVDDAYDEPDGHPGIVALAASGADAAYAALVIPAVNVTITDNDTPMVIVSPTDAGNAVAEGGATDKLSLQLGTAPFSDVTVNVVGDANVSTAPTSVIFTPLNWNVAQEITLAAVQDVVVEGEHQANVTFALSSSDVSYLAGSAATPPAQPVTVTDDDVAGVVVTETEGKTILAEAGTTDTYTVALIAQPTADVTVAVDGGTQVTPTPATLTFTPANWSTPQVVTAAAVQDTIDEVDPHPGDIAHRITTSAAGWANANVAGVVASITDDDVAEIVATQTEGVTKVIEGAATGDTITFQLKSQPTKDVSIIPTGDAQLAVSDAPIVLTPAAWDKPVTLQVKAVDDEEVEGDHEGLITFAVSSEDAGYARAAVTSIIVAVGDNDVDDDVPALDDDEEGSGRTPRGSTPPPATVRPRGSKDGATKPSRTKAGENRTDAGKKRTDAGLGTGSGTDEDGVRTGRRLGGEVTAAEEELKAEPSAFTKAKDWLLDHWMTWLPLLLLAAAVIGTATYVLRSNPVKKAQRASTKGAGGKGTTAAGGKRHMRPKKKKRKDDEDDAGGKPKRKR
jgi:hypothetical protein